MTIGVWRSLDKIPGIIIEVLSSTGEARVRPGDWFMVLIRCRVDHRIRGSSSGPSDRPSTAPPRPRQIRVSTSKSVVRLDDPGVRLRFVQSLG